MITSAERQLFAQWEQQQPEEKLLFHSLVGILLRDLPKEEYERDYDDDARLEKSLLEKEGHEALRRAKKLLSLLRHSD
jgi:hypothetical protein